MSTEYEAVLALIIAEPSITSLLGEWTGGGGFPLVIVGTISEEQPALPAISIRNQINTGDFGIDDNFLELHCYGASEPDSRALAQACYDFFRNSKGGVTGFAGEFNASIGLTTPDEKATNTIVELRVSSR